MVVSESSTQKNPAGWLVDLCVYAPIGFALDVHRYVPEFVERGRSQVAMARTIGKFAVDRLERQFPPLATVLDTLGLGVEQDTAEPNGEAGTKAAAAGDGGDGSGAPATAVTPVDTDTDTDTGTVQPAAALVDVPAAAVEEDLGASDDVPGEDGLAILGYASLAASQVVPRLASLGRDELSAIRRYEAAHRARRTVLNRVDQLLARSV